MTKEQMEQLAIDSAQNMGKAEEAWVPGVGKIIENGELTELGEEYFKKFNYSGRLVCPNPRDRVQVFCLLCSCPLFKDGQCYNCFPPDKE